MGLGEKGSGALERRPAADNMRMVACDGPMEHRALGIGTISRFVAAGREKTGLQVHEKLRQCLVMMDSKVARKWLGRTPCVESRGPSGSDAFEKSETAPGAMGVATDGWAFCWVLAGELPEPFGRVTRRLVNRYVEPAGGQSGAEYGGCKGRCPVGKVEEIESLSRS